ncbi:suppressor of disruption of TFIIS-like [Corylus avellana]|uniref:suppressor of disruption of TFIIS-like n=1 Tax=Corylus avellana TaxID=13451 RepID=UPI00286B630E|nr:suppressor of disruption of TFIIS-like [Corylus avellana]
MEYKEEYQQALAPQYECLLFDVDDTLYPLSSGLSKACTKNIEEYMVQKLGIEEEKVPEMNRMLYKNYGTTMAGLKAIGYDFDNDDYHRFVHGRLPYDALKPDHVLRSLLLSMPFRKVIFSNADKGHVAKALSRLGLEDCFDLVISFETLNPTTNENDNAYDNVVHIPCQPNSTSELPMSPVICKPFENAFIQAFKAGSINPQRTLFFDDSIRNIQCGKRMGLHTVHVGTSHRGNGVDYALESIHNIREALPVLWEAINEESGSIEYPRKMAIETSVKA